MWRSPRGGVARSRTTQPGSTWLAVRAGFAVQAGRGVGAVWFAPEAWSLAGPARSRVVDAVCTLPAALSWSVPVRVRVLFCVLLLWEARGAGEHPWPAKRHVATRCGGACCSWALVWNRTCSTPEPFVA